MRLEIIRIESYGVNTVELLARAIQFRSRAWLKYENGDVPLYTFKFIDITGANPHWFLSDDSGYALWQKLKQERFRTRMLRGWLTHPVRNLR
jgi:hypothetical protein